MEARRVPQQATRAPQQQRRMSRSSRRSRRRTGSRGGGGAAAAGRMLPSLVRLRLSGGGVYGSSALGGQRCRCVWVGEGWLLLCCHLCEQF